MSMTPGFLIKNGNSYVVAWRLSKSVYDSRKFSTLKEAVSFAKTDLNLSDSSHPTSNPNLEHLWVEQRFGDYALFWKTTGYRLLHRMTFQSPDDANFFADAFRRGHYTPSPFGHSLLLLPASVN